MAKYLITGGCGFIGSHLADRLVEQGHSLIILDDLSTGKKENAPKEASLVVGSVTDAPLVQTLCQEVDGCFHLAAIASVERSLSDWATVSSVNLGGTLTLFEALKKRPRPVVYASSAAVYGESSSMPLKEDAALSPLSPYGIDKLGGERHASLAWKLFGIPSIAFRFFNVYGPRQDPHSPYSGVISRFASRITETLPITIYGDGEQQRDFVSVFDVVERLTHAMSTLSEGFDVYNLCTGRASSLNTLITSLEEVVGKKVERRYAPPRQGDIRLSLGDTSKLERAFSCKPSLSLKEGLSRLIQT